MAQDNFKGDIWLSKRNKIPKFEFPESRNFYKHISGSWELEQHHLVLLENACHCLDRILSDRKILNEEKRFFVDRYEQPREHPAAISERQNKILFSRILRELNLDAEITETPRPPSLRY